MIDDMAPAAWGDPARRAGLPGHAARWLDRELGSGPGALPRVQPERVALAAPRLPVAARAALVSAVGAAHVLQEHEVRLRHAAGRSYLDLVRLRRGEADAPDAVVRPGSAAEVAAVLQVCAEHGVAVVPFGGGTSVVGGVTPGRGGRDAVVSLDLGRLDRLVEVDDVSLTAVLEPGLRGPAAERLLNARGLTLGHFPQSFEHATIGGFAATRSAGQASSGYGRFDDLVLGLDLQTPAGELRLGRGARSAAGPSLLGLAVGSEGAFGVITAVRLRVRRLPAVRDHRGYVFRSWADGTAALRRLAQDGLLPDVARLSDPDETRVQLALAGPGGAARRIGARLLAARGYGAGCLAVLGWEGTAEGVRRRRRAARGVLRGAGAVPLGRSVGRRWEHGRYDGPYLREDLLDAGVLVETLETSASWSELEGVRRDVRAALHGALPGGVVMCHVSHVYPHGASLYFTALARAAADPVPQWTAAKRAASDAIVAAGATITHHHAVGRDHRDHMPAEVGPLGVEVLRAVKGVLDPAGVLNPGVLVPEV